MQDEMTFNELVSSSVEDASDYLTIIHKHQKELEEKAEELAKEKAEELFNSQKEEYRLEVIKEINTAAVTAKRAEISRSSPYISENVTVNGKELHGCDFIPDTAIHDPLYDDVQLIYNDYSHEWQIWQKNGKRKFVSNFVVLAIVIVNATGIGQCKAIAVYLQGVDKPLIFKEGDISPSALKKQTQFFKKGTTITDKAFCESFVRAMKICCNIFFLTIPEHSGGNFLQEGVYNYTSALSVIPGLEELYADEIKQHQLIQHERKFEEVIAEHSTLFANCWKVKLAISVRVMSLLLPFYEAEGLKPDRFFVFSTNSDNKKKTLIALTSRFNYTLPVVTSVSSRINKVREALATGNDVTVIFTFFTGIDETRAFENALREIYMNITNENGFTASTRKIIEMITDFPSSIQEEYPAYYLSFAESAENVDVRTIQKMSGELDYSLIQFLTNNLDFAKKFIKAVVLETKKLLAHYMKSEHIELMTMLIATSILLKHLKIVSETEFQEIFDWSRKEANSRMTATEDICHKFQVAVCQSILSKELKIARQFEPPYYSNDGYTAFIAKADGSINFDEDVLSNIILPKISIVNTVKQLNKYLNEKGWLIGTHTNKRALKVTYNSGVSEKLDVFSYSNLVLDAETKAYVDDMIYNEFWYDMEDLPDSFVPVLSSVDGNKVAGYVLTEKMDVNRHEMYCGISRSGKSFALVQTSLFRAMQGETVLIFDQSGSFTVRELQKHVGKEFVDKFFSFWDVYQDGLPANLIDLKGCLSLAQQQEKLTRIYALASKTLGSYEELILGGVVERMIQDRKEDSNLALYDVLDYIRNDIDVDGKRIKDDAHRKLLCKIKAVLDNLRKASVASQNWGEFVEIQSKPIVVISTGADSVGKHSEIIDMMIESLYNFKQSYPDKRYTIVIDEAEDLYLHEKGSVNTVLRKGGKSGISMLLASQSFPNSNTLLGIVSGNCQRTRGYHPKANDVVHVARKFNCDREEVDTLRQGECFDKGCFFSRYCGENVTTTLKGRTVIFASATDNESTSG